MTWWRCEFGSDGKLRSVERCPRASEGTTFVVYVRADDELAARVAADRERHRIDIRERTARYRAEGRCYCGREKEDNGRKVCNRCLQRNASAARRQRQIKQGKPVTEPLPTPRKISMAQRRAEKADEARLAVFLEIQEALISKGSGFLRWFHAEIAKLQKGKAA